LFHAVQSSGNYTCEQDTPTKVFRECVISYAWGAYKVFIEIFVVETRKRAHSIGNSKG
jgi:hypothetical protein